MRTRLLLTSLLLVSGTVVDGATRKASPALPAFFFQSNEGAIIGKAAGLNAAFRPTAVEISGSSGRLSVLYVDANAASIPEAVHATGGTLNAITGDDAAQWATTRPMYSTVLYRSLYPKINMRFGGDDRLLKSEYEVRPGGDPARIRIRYRGATAVEIQQDGSLRVATRDGVMTEAPPIAFQMSSRGRREIDVSYTVDSQHEVGFQVGAYDPALPLIIDPTITFSTYVGGNGADVVTGMATDASGNVYVTGYTDSPDFPLNGALQAKGGSVDAFVVKISGTGDRILYATYIGGVGDDRAYGIRVDSSNRAVIVGYETSTNFPVLNASQRTNAGGKDAFVLMLSASGSTLAFSTLYGGSGSDCANAVALDGSGNIYVAGDTTSTNLRMVSGYQSSNKGRQDAFAAKLTAAGSIVYSTYFGGIGDDKANGVAVDASGAAYIAGETSSPDLPASTGFQKSNGGGQDAFIAKLSSTGSSLSYASYLGGTSGLAGQPESAAAITVDTSGNAFVVGVTSSANFPTAAAYQSTFGGGGTDAFLSKVNPTGSGLLFSTFLGGVGADSARAVALESAGTILVSGTTFSVNFPTLNGTQASKNGQTDAFLTRFTATGADVFFSTYVGGAGLDAANAIASSPAGDVWIAGQTTSVDFPLSKPLQSFGTPEGNGFVMQLGIQNLPPSFTAVTPSTGNGMQQTFQLIVSDPNGGADIKQVVVIINNQFVSMNSCYFMWTQPTNAIYLASDDNSTWSSVAFGSGSVANRACVSLHHE